jgi:CRISPR system Cascade subunit CasE
MMYLTRFIINQSRFALGWLANPYRVHQRLRMAYPTEERLLFRIEENDDGAVILAQSQVAPDWQAAFADFEVLADTPETKSFSLQLVQGGMYHFRLLANPTVTREKKRLGLVKEEDQRAWLERQLDRSGARLLGCQVVVKGLQRSRKNPQKAEGHQTHLAVLYEGVLRVENAEALAEAVKAGIGHAKAYGFGLLSLAKSR